MVPIGTGRSHCRLPPATESLVGYRRQWDRTSLQHSPYGFAPIDHEKQPLQGSRALSFSEVLSIEELRLGSNRKLASKSLGNPLEINDFSL
jgi:hypothetical protein